MNLCYIKAKVSIKVFGISGESQEGVSCILTGNIGSREDAVRHFEKYCWEKFASMNPDKIRIDYLEIAPEIKI